MTKPEMLIALTEGIDKSQARKLAAVVRATFTEAEGVEWERLSNYRRQTRFLAKINASPVDVALIPAPQINASSKALALIGDEDIPEALHINAASKGVALIPEAPAVVPMVPPTPPSLPPENTIPQTPPPVGEAPRPADLDGQGGEVDEAANARRKAEGAAKRAVMESVERIMYPKGHVWLDPEKTALRKVYEADPERFTGQIPTVAAYHALPESSFPRGKGGAFEDFRRRSLLTLLRHWAAEHRQAELFFEKNPKARKAAAALPAVPAPIDPPLSEEFKAWFSKTYTRANPQTHLSAIPENVRRNFAEDCPNSSISTP